MTTPPNPSFRVIGGGRAGRSMAEALQRRGWVCRGVLGRTDPTGPAGRDVELVVVAVPDGAIADVAEAMESTAAAVIHLSGAKTLDVLDPHDRRGSVHPLMSLPEPGIGAERLLSGGVFAVAGDPMADRVVEALGGRAIAVAEDRRASYHAAAAVAANHLVVLCAQIERLAERADVPTSAFLELMASTIDNVGKLGAKAALTGPAARGDRSTIADHLAAMDPADHDLYLTLADEAARMSGHRPFPQPSG